jgi:hypothetical protein
MQTQKDAIGNFDISKNDSQIIFSFYKANIGSSIYISNIDGSDIKLLISSNKSKSYYNPRYSIDGEKIVFLECDIDNINYTTICTSNVDGSNIERLTKGGEIITEANFSSYSNNIYFSKANEVNNYSPLARKQPHGFDIYSINIINKEITKLTDLESYGIYQISEVDSNIYLMQIFNGSDGGMFLFTRGIQDEFKRIVPINNPRGDASLYYTPRYSEQFNIMAFIAPYELYIMDLESKKAKLLFDNKGHSHIEYFCFYHTQRKILFLKKGETSLWSINFDGTDLKKIPIVIH